MRGLLAAAPAERQARLDAGRVDTAFEVGDRALLRTKERLDAADIGKLRPREGKARLRFTVTACPSPDALALPRRMRGSPAVNVDRPEPSFERAGGVRRLPGLFPTRARRASARRSCGSPASWCAA